MTTTRRRARRNVGLDYELVHRLCMGLSRRFASVCLCEDEDTGEEWVRVEHPRDGRQIDLPFDISLKSPELLLAGVSPIPSIEFLDKGVPLSWILASARQRARLEAAHLRAALRDFRDWRRDTANVINAVPSWSPRRTGARIRNDLVAHMVDDILDNITGRVWAGRDYGHVTLLWQNEEGECAEIPVDTRANSCLGSAMIKMFPWVVPYWTLEFGWRGRPQDLFRVKPHPGLAREVILNMAAACRKVVSRMTMLDTRLRPMEQALASFERMRERAASAETRTDAVPE